jgi:hypothetical protein
MKKTLAVLLTITFPIWIIPAGLLSIIFVAVTECYEDMLKLIDYISKHFGVEG